MKKSAILLPLIITALFVSFTLGLFIGRNFNYGEIQTTRFWMDQPALSDMVPPSVTEENSPVNINTADLDELCTLPGIGKTLAQRILDYREANGPFHHVGDLLMVEGMGPQILENILNDITTGG